MTQLATNVSATSRRWRVDSMPAARLLRVDDELVEVRARSPQDSIITVRRGIEGSTAATHTAGTELEAPVFGGEGGEQTIRLLGPYSFAYNTPDVDSGLALGTPGMIPTGAMVFRTWVVATTGFQATGDVTIDIVTAPDSDNFNGVALSHYVGSLAAQVSDEYQGEIQIPSSEHYAAVVLEPSRLLVYLTATNPTAGAADVYALIAEPA